MDKIRVSIVSYLNSKPFLYGLKKSSIVNQIELTTDIPSVVASKLIMGQTDIGLIPVGALNDLRNFEIIGDYCIGAYGNVRTVVLISDVPLDEIETILLDHESRTSVLLARILARFHWKKNILFRPAYPGYEINSVRDTTAGVVIGDRVFKVEKRYKYSLDLSEEWVRFTGLPFVFAVWAANKNVSKQFRKDFNEALESGIKNISEIVALEKDNYPGIDITDYYLTNLSFPLDDPKREGMKRFVELAGLLNSDK
jgi:chorismate dehydratase